MDKYTIFSIITGFICGAIGGAFLGFARHRIKVRKIMKKFKKDNYV